MKTGFVWDERYMWHQNDPSAASVEPSGWYVEPGEQIENANSKRRIKNLLDATGLTEKLRAIRPFPASNEQILRVHSRAFLDRLDAQNATGGNVGPLASFGPGGVDIVKLAAGGVIAAVDAVLDGVVENAYALVRPCGHHATSDSGLGFAILNNGAIAAHHALATRGLKRVLFVDWDVHHGNGTEAIFWNDPRVLTISLHQDNCFPPYSGGRDRFGGEAGEGFNVNVPLPSGSGNGAYLAAMDRIVLPAIAAFRPELIIVPCGFDAGGFDSLGRMMLYAETFRVMTRKLMRAAQESGNAPIVMCHEGGYHAPTVGFMGLAVIEELSGESTGVQDPFQKYVDHMTGQDLQPHQNDVIAAIEQDIAIYLDRWSAAAAR